jgi:predicted DsbA family dithiol-disulfide isomerase
VTLLRVAALLALSLSTALLLQYTEPASRQFCGADSGCAAVQRYASEWVGRVYLIPLGGVLAYGSVFALSFHLELRRVLTWLAGVGGMLGLGLLAVQVLGAGAVCSLCLVVDLLAVVAGIAGASLARSQHPQHDPLRWWGWALLFALAINAPSAWSWATPARTLPDSIAQLQQPGALDVIEFVDFQCPHCRRLHPVLKREVQLATTPVRVQRFHFPLPFHPLAEAAARAAICGAEQGKAEEMADALFEQPLVDGVWFEHARALALDVATFEACLHAAATSSVIEEHRALYRSTGSQRLPLTYVGDRVIDGAPPSPVVVQAFLDALAPRRVRVASWVFALGLLLAVMERLEPILMTLSSSGNQSSMSRRGLD